MDKFDGIKETAREELDGRVTSEGLDPEQAHDVITEIADGAVPVYHSGLLELASDPEVANHVSELGPAFDGKPTVPNIIAANVYDLVQQDLHERARELVTLREEAEEELEEAISDIDDADAGGVTAEESVRDVAKIAEAIEGYGSEKVARVKEILVKYIGPPAVPEADAAVAELQEVF